MVISFTYLAAVIPWILVLCHLYIDYQRFMALGPGGTPKTVLGYCKVKALSMFALRDAYQPPKIPGSMEHEKIWLSTLPQRKGPRPSTLGIAPHRQIDQIPAFDMYEQLSRALRSIVDDNVHILEGTSCFEKHVMALFSDFPQRRTCKGEICHAHPSDGSMHLTLHPADVKIMLEAGWGERHPLARGGWLENFVPGGFVMVYAPRNDRELEVVLEIVCASACFVGGKEVKCEWSKRRDSGQSESATPVG